MLHRANGGRAEGPLGVCNNARDRLAGDSDGHELRGSRARVAHADSFGGTIARDRFVAGARRHSVSCSCDETPMRIERRPVPGQSQLRADATISTRTDRIASDLRRRRSESAWLPPPPDSFKRADYRPMCPLRAARGATCGAFAAFPFVSRGAK
jgi:hypothetical protein